MTLSVLALSKILKEWPEKYVFEMLSEFSCSKDKDVQRFLRKRAIEFEKKQVSRTYLLFDSESASKLVAYFTIAISSLYVDSLQCDVELIEKMNVNRGIAQSYLIGQLGKIDGYEKRIGNFAIYHALDPIEGVNKVVGCPVIRLDCKDALVNYYEGKGFRLLSKGDNDLNKMIMMIS